MRIPAFGGRMGRLVATLAVLPIAAFVLAACAGSGEQVHQTGDTAPPGLIGETANGIGFPHEVVTTEGIAAAGLYIWIFIIAAVIFVLIEGLLLFITWRFRRRETDGEFPKQVHGNNRLEIIWTVIPAIIVTGMFVASAVVLADVESMTDEPAVTVDVTAYTFGWNFDYPDEGVSAPLEPGQAVKEMVVPVNETIRFRLQTADTGVIHSFYVPSFFYKLDVVPGRLNQFEVTIEKPGLYGGQCAEFCGLGHGIMFFNVRAVERPEYDAWIAELTAAAEAAAAPAESPAPSEEAA